jgi:hypothetical protein
MFWLERDLTNSGLQGKWKITELQYYHFVMQFLKENLQRGTVFRVFECVFQSTLEHTGIFSLSSPYNLCGMVGQKKLGYV